MSDPKAEAVDWMASRPDVTVTFTAEEADVVWMAVTSWRRRTKVKRVFDTCSAIRAKFAKARAASR